MEGGAFEHGFFTHLGGVAQMTFEAPPRKSPTYLIESNDVYFGRAKDPKYFATSKWISWVKKNMYGAESLVGRLETSGDAKIK